MTTETAVRLSALQDVWVRLDTVHSDPARAVALSREGASVRFAFDLHDQWAAGPVIEAGTMTALARRWLRELPATFCEVRALTGGPREPGRIAFPRWSTRRGLARFEIGRSEEADTFRLLMTGPRSVFDRLALVWWRAVYDQAYTIPASRYADWMARARPERRATLLGLTSTPLLDVEST